MNKRLRYVVLALGLAVPLSANAFWGIGDVTFDPTNYGEIMKLYDQGVELYKTAMKQLESLDKMQQTINEASQAYDRLANIDVHKMADDLKPGKYMKYANNTNTFRMMRAELSSLQSEGGGKVNFVSGQLSRLDDLEKMTTAQNTSLDNTQKASKDIDVRKSGQITAQSTATLTALAAVEEQRRMYAEMAQSQEAENQRDLLFGSADTYKAIGGGKTTP